MIGLEGAFAPLVTPFTDDTSGISEIRLARLMRRLKEHNVKGFVLLGEVGQFTSIGYSERKDLLEIAIREAGGMPVLVNVSALSTMAALDLAQHAGRHGARAAILMAPYFGHYSSEEIEGYFKNVSQYAGLPIIVVDPAKQLTPEIIAKLPNYTRVFIAEPNDHEESRPDSFKIEDASVSPLNLLLGLGHHPGMLKFMDEYGWNRVCKAALEEMGVDCGPPRPPRQGLNLEHSKELEALLAAARNELESATE